jgi:hypothetical protein
VVFACARDLRFCHAPLRPEDPAKGSPVLVVPACDTAPHPRSLPGNPRFPYPGQDPAAWPATRPRVIGTGGTTGLRAGRANAVTTPPASMTWCPGPGVSGGLNRRTRGDVHRGIRKGRALVSGGAGECMRSVVNTGRRAGVPVNHPTAGSGRWCGMAGGQRGCPSSSLRWQRGERRRASRLGAEQDGPAAPGDCRAVACGAGAGPGSARRPG